MSAMELSNDDSLSASSAGCSSGALLSSEDIANEASRYSRENYGSGNASNRDDSSATSLEKEASTLDQHLAREEIYPEISRLRRRKLLRRRILLGVACTIVAVIGVFVAYASWFVNELDTELALGDAKTVSELEKILVPEVPGQPYYVLVMGSDSREGNYSSHIDQRGDNERSDVMMLVRIDSKNKKVTLLSIPRDTPYQLDDGSYVKINEMFNNDGVVGAVKAVSKLTGLPISHHAEVRISGLEAIVDLLGGVTVDVPTELSYVTTDQEEVTVPAGRQTLNGRQAQIFARARHEFEGNQDQQRQGNVRTLLQAIVDSILSRPVSEIPNIVLQIARYVDTDYKTFDLVSLAMGFSGGKTTMYNGTGPSEGDSNPGTNGKWLCYLNPEGWQKVASVVDSGEDPSGLDFSETQTLWTDVTDQPEFKGSMAFKYYYGGASSD